MKIVVGHGRPNVGIFRRLPCSTALIAGYSSAYETRNHPIGLHTLRGDVNESCPLTTPDHNKSAACNRKSAANSQAAGLMRVKKATWYAIADHAQSTASRPLVQRSCARRDQSPMHTKTDASHNATTAGHSKRL